MQPPVIFFGGTPFCLRSYIPLISGRGKKYLFSSVFGKPFPPSHNPILSPIPAGLPPSGVLPPTWYCPPCANDRSTGVPDRGGHQVCHRDRAVAINEQRGSIFKIGIAHKFSPQCSSGIPPLQRLPKRLQISRIRQKSVGSKCRNDATKECLSDLFQRESRFVQIRRRIPSRLIFIRRR